MAVGQSRRPQGYDPGTYPAVAVTVDIVVLTIRDGQLLALLIERAGEPFRDWWALPGGFVHPDETLDQAAARELREETGVEAAAYLEQVRAYGDPGRDPRMRVVSVAYLAVMSGVGELRAGTDARNAELFSVQQLLGRRPKRKLAFDHHTILRDCVEHARTKLESSSLATAFVGPEFTMSDLRGVYEAAWGVELDPGNFRRKVLQSPGFVEPTGSVAPPGPEGGKPPEIYRSRSVVPLETPVSRPRRRKGS